MAGGRSRPRPRRDRRAARRASRRVILARVLRILLRGAAVVVGILLVLGGIGYAVGSFWIARAEPDASAAPESVPGRLLDVGAHPVHRGERGSGPPLLLVPGSPRSPS